MALRNLIATRKPYRELALPHSSQAVVDRPYSTNLTTAVCTKALERGPDPECRSGSNCEVLRRINDFRSAPHCGHGRWRRALPSDANHLTRLASSRCRRAFRASLACSKRTGDGLPIEFRSVVRRSTPFFLGKRRSWRRCLTFNPRSMHRNLADVEAVVAARWPTRPPPRRVRSAGSRRIADRSR
jgi:hypothetical protein